MYLASTELCNPYTPRACHVIRRLRSELRNDLALVELEPPLGANIYNTLEDLAQVILATRHEGFSFFPVTEWPLPVYICALKSKMPPEKDTINSKDIIILDWGEVRK